MRIPLRFSCRFGRCGWGLVYYRNNTKAKVVIIDGGLGITSSILFLCYIQHNVSLTVVHTENDFQDDDVNRLYDITAQTHPPKR
jgi:hypothetical protein